MKTALVGVGGLVCCLVACGQSTGLDCGPGTHREGLLCVATTEADGGLIVLADAGSPARRAHCDSTAQCDSGQTCAYGSRTCIAASGVVCGLPSMGGGGQYVGAACGGANKCDDGFTCVAGAASRKLESDGTYSPLEGRCMIGCDPCAPNCPGSLSCLALGPGQVGGFCQSGALGSEGVSCNRTLCQGLCPSSNSPVCTAPLCVPNDHSLLVSALSSTGSASTDCEADEWCVKQGAFFYCRPGTTVSRGGRCGGQTYCAEGACLSGINICLGACPCVADAGVCVTAGGGSVCVPDGLLPIGSTCGESRSCESWLECRASQCLPK